MNKCVLALLAVVAVIVNAVLFTYYGAALIAAAAAAQPVAAAIALVGLAFLWLASVYVMYKVLRKGCYD